MIISTKGIVLRVIKYGDSSIICNIFTELLGLQTYLVKGVRSEKKQSQKGNILRPGNILDLQVYHQNDKNLQYIKEYRLDYFFETIGDNVIKNTLLLYAVEVLSNLVQTADAQEELFEFATDFLHKMDQARADQLGNMPVFFLKEAAKKMGYAIDDNYSSSNCYLNTYEGCFQPRPGEALPVFDRELSYNCYLLIKETTFENITTIKVPAADRSAILEGYLHFVQWHDKSFKPLKSLPVLQAILH